MRVGYPTVLTLLALLANESHAIKILGLFPHTGRSHQMVFEPLLRTLAERGHVVTAVSFFPLERPPVGYRDVSLEGIAPPGIETVDMSVFEDSLWGLERIVEQLLSFHPLADMALEVCRRLVDWPPLMELFQEATDYDLILVENFNSDCLLGLARAHGVRAPAVALLSSSLMPWSFDRLGVPFNPAYVPVVSTPFTGRLKFRERLENSLMHIYFNVWYRYMIQTKEQAIIEKHLKRKVTDLQVIAKETCLMLVNTHHSLLGVRPLLPGVVEVGGMHIEPSEHPLPSHIVEFLNGAKHGVVLFSFGSLIKTATISKEKEDLFLRVLSNLPQRVIWKFETSNEKGNITGNILRLKWIPQSALLHHPKVVAFIAHGGLLGMTEAVDAGVPMLVIPFFGDQPGNAAAAAAAGLATVLPYRDLTENALQEALQKVLSPEMRDSAARLSSVWRDRLAPPLDTAVYWVERAARLGPTAAAALHSPARDMPVHQLLLIDVLAVCLAALGLTLLVAFYLVRMTVCCLQGLLNRKNKEKVN